MRTYQVFLLLSLHNFMAEAYDLRDITGSVFGKDMKEELRLKKLGSVQKKYDPNSQPWLMRLNGEGGRKYRGIREGGVLVQPQQGRGLPHQRLVQLHYDTEIQDSGRGRGGEEKTIRICVLRCLLWQKCSNQLRMLFPNKET